LVRTWSALTLTGTATFGPAGCIRLSAPLVLHGQSCPAVSGAGGGGEGKAVGRGDPGPGLPVENAPASSFAAADSATDASIGGAVGPGRCVRRTRRPEPAASHAPGASRRRRRLSRRSRRGPSDREALSTSITARIRGCIGGDGDGSCSSWGCPAGTLCASGSGWAGAGIKGGGNGGGAGCGSAAVASGRVLERRVSVQGSADGLGVRLGMTFAVA
jgi:hypothetical protein